MLTPAAGVEGVKDFIIDCVKMAGPDACPPLISGRRASAARSRGRDLVEEGAVPRGRLRQLQAHARRAGEGAAARATGSGSARRVMAAITTSLGIHVLTYLATSRRCPSLSPSSATHTPQRGDAVANLVQGLLRDLPAAHRRKEATL
jgi:hypothetical protein